MNHSLTIIGLILIIVAVACVGLFVQPGINPDYGTALKHRSELRAQDQSYEHVTLEAIPKFNPIWSDPLFWAAAFAALVGVICVLLGAVRTRRSPSLAPPVTTVSTNVDTCDR